MEDQIETRTSAPSPPQEPISRAQGPRSGGRTALRTALVLAAIAAVVLGILVARGWRPSSSTADRDPAPATAGMPRSAAIEATYGIRLTGVVVTAGGGMIQLRYEVLDSDLSHAVHDIDAAPFVVDASGHKYADPGMAGHSHLGKTRSPGTSDFVLLANAGGRVRPGDVVTVDVGGLQLRGVPVL